MGFVVFPSIHGYLDTRDERPSQNSKKLGNWVSIKADIVKNDVVISFPKNVEKIQVIVDLVKSKLLESRFNVKQKQVEEDGAPVQLLKVKGILLLVQFYFLSKILHIVSLGREASIEETFEGNYIFVMTLKERTLSTIFLPVTPELRTLPFRCR